jgi:hypothetical protein
MVDAKQPGMTATPERRGHERGTDLASAGIDAAGYQEGMPALPPGHTSQVAWGFRDPHDGLLYDFIRVYSPGRHLHGLGLLCQLDQDRCYWITSQTDEQRAGPPRVLSRWIDYAQASKLAGRTITFRRFSSPLPRPDETPRLLQLANLAGGSRPADRALSGELASAGG